jgi:hypothetical protein
MTFAELLDEISWSELRGALLWCYPDERQSLEGYRVLYGKLKGITPEPSNMRIVVEETYRPKIDDQPFWDVTGRNGDRNRDQADFEHIRITAEPGWADEETNFSLSFHRWAEWLGMSIDTSTLENLALPQIAAHCMSDMTLHGFEEADAQSVLEELKERASELDAMTPEQRAKALIPLEEVTRASSSTLERES